MSHLTADANILCFVRNTGSNTMSHLHLTAARCSCTWILDLLVGVSMRVARRLEDPLL